MSITELDKIFAQPNEQLPEDVSGELRSVMRLHSLSEQEVFFKWEAYSIKLGSENTNLDYKTVRDFKKDLQDALERDARGKVAAHSATKKTINSTPRSGAGDVYGVLDGLVSGTPGPRTAIKRRNQYETPMAKVSKTTVGSSPHGSNGNLTGEKPHASFDTRQHAGQILESLNANLVSEDLPAFDGSETRVKIKTSTDVAKFNYRPMAMKLSEASEILDDRIDEFVALVQKHHGFPDSAFGNPAARSTSEIIAVGRIATDSEGSIDGTSLTLESSRRMGAGLRVPLKIENQAFDLFPGKIVALKGINAAGESFRATEIISLPLLPLQMSTPNDIQAHSARVQGISAASSSSRPLNIQIASGPYTTDADLFFAALHALTDRAAENRVDVLILTGPFLDTEHPLIASGDFSLPSSYPVPEDQQTLSDAFRYFISSALSQLAASSPTTTIILVPSTRDAALKHVSYPQDRLQKRELGLPKQAICVTNPITLSINELVVGVSSQDVLLEMQRQCVSHGHAGANALGADDRLARLTSELIAQRHFFPVFPPLAPEKLARPTTISVDRSGGPVKGEEEEESGEGGNVSGGVTALNRTAQGASLDVGYLKLGEWWGIRPDLLVLPSALPPFAKVVDNVVAVNPGPLSKRKAAGTYVDIKVLPRVLSDEEKAAEYVHHELYARARVDVVRI